MNTADAGVELHEPAEPRTESWKTQPDVLTVVTAHFVLNT